jgi:hypothetical protein
MTGAAYREHLVSLDPDPAQIVAPVKPRPWVDPTGESPTPPAGGRLGAVRGQAGNVGRANFHYYTVYYFISGRHSLRMAFHIHRRKWGYCS